MIRSRLTRLYHQIDRRSGGILTIFEQAARRFDRVRGAEAAASIGYYAFFSLFPLLLFLASVVGFLLVSTDKPGAVLEFITESFPVARDFIRENLVQILEKRGTGSVIGLIGLVWSASSVFITLARNINRAWPGAAMRTLVQSRLVAVIMIFAVALLLLLWLAATLVFDLLPRLEVPIRGSQLIYRTLFWAVLSTSIPWLLAFFVFYSLYRWAPNTYVRPLEAMWGAVFSTVTWQITTAIFTWYLSSGLARFEAVYGSLAAIVALLLWIYLSAFITLFGAHISYAVAGATRLQHTRQAQEIAAQPQPSEKIP